MSKIVKKIQENRKDDDFLVLKLKGEDIKKLGQLNDMLIRHHLKHLSL
jgi:hypothetical protein